MLTATTAVSRVVRTPTIVGSWGKALNQKGSILKCCTVSMNSATCSRSNTVIDLHGLSILNMPPLPSSLEILPVPPGLMGLPHPTSFPIPPNHGFSTVIFDRFGLSLVRQTASLPSESSCHNAVLGPLCLFIRSPSPLTVLPRNPYCKTCQAFRLVIPVLFLVG